MELPLNYIIDTEVVTQTISRASVILDKYSSLVKKRKFDESDDDNDEHVSVDIQYKLEIAHYYYVCSRFYHIHKLINMNICELENNIKKFNNI